MSTTGPSGRLSAPGHMGVDYEERVDFDRLRRYRLGRAQAALESSECGAFLLFDQRLPLLPGELGVGLHGGVHERVDLVVDAEVVGPDDDV